MDFLSYLSSKKKIRLPLSFLVTIVSFMLCSHRLHGVIIYNGTDKNIKIISFFEMVKQSMRMSKRGKFWFEISEKNNTILPKKSVSMENTADSNYGMPGVSREAKFECLCLKFKYNEKNYELKTKEIQKSNRYRLKTNTIALCVMKPTSKENKDRYYLCENDKWDDLNMRFLPINQEKK